MKNTINLIYRNTILGSIEMALVQHMIKMEPMKIKLTLVLAFIFQFSFSQTPCIQEKYNFNNFIDAFIYINNDENFKPDLSLIHVLSLYYKDKGYMITITRDNIKSTMINPKSKYLEFFKYKNFDLLLQGKTAKDLDFFIKIISNKRVSSKSKIEFVKPHNSISYDPYQWFLLFDREMNLINYSLPEQENKIKEIFEKFGIPTSKIGEKDCE